MREHRQKAQASNIEKQNKPGLDVWVISDRKLSYSFLQVNATPIHRHKPLPIIILLIIIHKLTIKCHNVTVWLQQKDSKTMRNGVLNRQTECLWTKNCGVKSSVLRHRLNVFSDPFKKHLYWAANQNHVVKTIFTTKHQWQNACFKSVSSDLT